MEREDRPVDRIARHGRTIRDSGASATEAAGELLGELAGVAREELRTRPYVTLGCALGAGLLLGGGLPLRFVTGTALFGARLALTQTARRIVTDAANHDPEA